MPIGKLAIFHFIIFHLTISHLTISHFVISPLVTSPLATSPLGTSLSIHISLSRISFSHIFKHISLSHILFTPNPNSFTSNIPSCLIFLHIACPIYLMDSYEKWRRLAVTQSTVGKRKCVYLELIHRKESRFISEMCFSPQAERSIRFEKRSRRRELNGWVTIISKCFQECICVEDPKGKKLYTYTCSYFIEEIVLYRYFYYYYYSIITFKN